MIDSLVRAYNKGKLDYSGSFTDTYCHSVSADKKINAGPFF